MTGLPLKIGVDFDNTIVCCDDLFYQSALEKRLIPEKIGATKEEVRNYLRKIDREADWTELQGYVYGKLIQKAVPFPGVREFFTTCRKRGISTVIISHKTRRPYLGPPYDLHQAAYDWLDRNGFFEAGPLERSQVFFELKKDDKLRRIEDEHCTVFIDDLPEFLNDPHFSKGIRRILFDPLQKQVAPIGVTQASSWKDIQHLLLPVS